MAGADHDAATLLDLRAALETVRGAAADGPLLRLGLACGFTPLHLPPLLTAYALRRRPDAQVVVETGPYGDTVAAVRALIDRRPDCCIVVLHWPDLDPRLSPRLIGRALPAPDDLRTTAHARLERLARAVADVECPVVVVAPGTTFPSSFAAEPGRLGTLEAELRSAVADTLARLAAAPTDVRVVRPCEAAADLRQTLRADFPFRVEHASALARDAVAQALPAPAKKGVITDLDDTLWRGLVGEIGPDGVRWDLDGGAQLHALYQQTLAVLASHGVLIGVVSKNDPEVARAALHRADLVLDPDRVFPVEASWEPKSAAVARVLQQWNIAASDVVVVDDSDWELAEIAQHHPGITALRFDGTSADTTARVLATLRSLFPTERATTAEDLLRLDSLRAHVEVDRARTQAGDHTEFLRNLDATLTVDTHGAHRSSRAYDLVQKTNQFNLNGRRFEPAAWRALGEREGSVGAVVGYRDRFGNLGDISVLTGVVRDGRLDVDAWVLSCRAFARAVEPHVLLALADACGVDAIAFDFVATQRNHLIGEFLASLGGDLAAQPVVVPVETLRHAHDAIHSLRVLDDDAARD